MTKAEDKEHAVTVLTDEVVARLLHTPEQWDDALQDLPPEDAEKIKQRATKETKTMNPESNNG